MLMRATPGITCDDGGRPSSSYQCSDVPIRGGDSHTAFLRGPSRVQNFS